MMVWIVVYALVLLCSSLQTQPNPAWRHCLQPGAEESANFSIADNAGRRSPPPAKFEVTTPPCNTIQLEVLHTSSCINNKQINNDKRCRESASTLFLTTTSRPRTQVSGCQLVRYDFELTLCSRQGARSGAH